MSKIEKHLHEHFASLMENAPDNDQESSAAAASSSREPALRDYVPAALDETFAKVNTVTERSPAHTAGLQQGDLIRNFGWVNKSNHDGLKKVAECVQANEGVGVQFDELSPTTCKLLTFRQRPILVKVSRVTAAPSQQELQLTLTPRRDWGGRGLLGCHILPL